MRPIPHSAVSFLATWMVPRCLSETVFIVEPRGLCGEMSFDWRVWGLRVPSSKRRSELLRTHIATQLTQKADWVLGFLCGWSDGMELRRCSRISNHHVYMVGRLG